MAEDKTVRLILGILLVLIGLPLFGMGGMMGGFDYNMMGYAYGGFWPWTIVINLTGLCFLGLGIYLIYISLKN